MGLALAPLQMASRGSLVLIYMLLLVGGVASSKEEFILSVGQQQLISQSQKIHRIALGNAAIVALKSLKKGKELLITGKSPGTTDLIIWYGRGKKVFSLHVLAKDSALLLPTVKQFLAELEGVQVRQMGKDLLIEGKLLRPNDRHTIHRLSKNHPRIKDMTEMHPKAMQITMNYVKRRLAEEGYSALNVSLGGDKMFIVGSVHSETDRKRASEIAKKIYPDVELLLDTEFGSGEMIFVDVKMVEIRKKALLALGIQWQQAIHADINAQLSSSGSSATLGLSEAIPITIHTLQAKGLARILANPKLTCRFENACTFHAGGEIPIPLIGERRVNVIFKNYGIQLSLTPHLVAGDRLIIEIDIEFSDIDFATAINGIPGLLKNNLKTTAKVRFNQSVVLSGLVHQHHSKNSDKLPLFGSLPLIGELFKSRSFKRAESEFLLFLTPLPMIAGDRRTQQQIDAMLNRYRKSGQKLRYHLND